MLGVSRPIYVNVDSPNLGFPYFNILGGYQWKKHPVLLMCHVDFVQVYNATSCIANVDDYSQSTRLLAATTLRSVLSVLLGEAMVVVLSQAI